MLAAVRKAYEGDGMLSLENCDTADLNKNGEGEFAKYAFDREKEEQLLRDSLKMVELAED